MSRVYEPAILCESTYPICCSAKPSWPSRQFGHSWSDLKDESGRIVVTKYYPNVVEAADGTIVVTSHNTGDDAFMPRWPNGSLANGSHFLGGHRRE